MTSSEKGETLINEIGNLYSIQMASNHEAAIFGWTSEQSLLASDKRLARITSLVRQLAELDEPATADDIANDGWIGDDNTHHKLNLY